MITYFANQILNLTRQLFPKGRAYIIPPRKEGTGEMLVTEQGDKFITDESGNILTTEDFSYGAGGQIETFMKVFGGDGGNRLGTTERTRADALSILDAVLPMGEGFTDGTYDPNDNDCNYWEGNLGLIQYGVTSGATPTRQQRMQAIAQKMRYPGSDAPRQSAEYLQDSLQSAGFNVYVYENLNNQSPEDVLGPGAGGAFLGGFELGGAYLGELFSGTVIANFIDETQDSLFTVPAPNYHGTFFIGGSTLGTFASVPLVQKAQFRQMILQLKPAHLMGFLFINYV